MTTGGPTTGASEARWRHSSVLARLVRFVAFALPVVVSWLTVRAASSAFWAPPGWWGRAIWVLQAVFVAAATSLLVERVARRLLPLAALFEVSLVFPDDAPSRFSVALRSGNVRRLMANGALPAAPIGTDVASTAERALELVGALSGHDRRTRGHTERVRAYAEVIAVEMGLSETDRERLAWGVLLHDIGKVTVPAEVLNKETKLTDDEWQLLRGHPGAAVELLAPLRSWLGPWLLAASEHHERWDGTGYPNGLSGTDISLAGRICAVADAYDVITSKRSYKAPMSAEAARAELVRCAGTQFDPAVVRAFLNAGLGRRLAGGPLAWLAEVPSIGQLSNVAASGAGTVGAGVAAGAAAVTVTLGGMVGVLGPEAPDALAFEDSSAEIDLVDGTAADTVLPTADDTTTSSGPTEPDAASTGASSTTSSSPPDTRDGTTSGPPTTAPSTSDASDSGSTTASTGPGSTLPNGRTPSSTIPVTGPPSTSTTAPSTTSAPATTTTTTTTTTSTTMQQGAVVFSLDNGPGGDTTSSEFLPLVLGSAGGGSLGDYDTDRDDRPGLFVKKSDGLSETDLKKRQTWTITLDADVVLDGQATLTVWIADKDFHDHDHELGIEARLTICSPTCSTVRTGSWSEDAPGGDTFRPVTIAFGGLDLALVAGDEVRLEVAVPKDLSERDLNLAYDATVYPAALTIG